MARFDYAVTADGGDYTVHLMVGIDPEGRMYLLDRWRKQSSSDEWIEAFCDLVLEWKPLGWAEEKGQISAGVGPALDKRQRERSAYCYRQETRQSERNPFAAAWLLKDSMCAMLLGSRSSKGSC
jgi:hypothetical protein